MSIEHPESKLKKGVIIGIAVLAGGAVLVTMFREPRQAGATKEKTPETNVVVNVAAGAEASAAAGAVATQRFRQEIAARGEDREGPAEAPSRAPLVAADAPVRSAVQASSAEPERRSPAQTVSPPMAGGNEAAAVVPTPESPAAIAAWPGIARGASIYGRPTGAICEDGLRRGVTFDMNAVEPALALADGRELPPGTRLRVRVGDVRLGNGDDPSIARFELAAVEWNGQWQPVTAAAYRVPFERRRSVGASALKGAAIGAAAGTIVSLVFKTDLAPSLLIGAAAGAAIGASTAGASQLSCIDPAQTKLGFEF